MDRPGFFTRAGAYRMLEGTPAHPGRRIVRIALAILILSNVVAVTLESVRDIEQQYTDAFRVFEWVSVAIFSLEYVLRIWACTEGPRYVGLTGRLRYAMTPMALIDLLAILPSLLGPWLSIDTRMLRAARLLRIFKLTRHSSSMDLLLTVLRQEAGSIGSAMFIMIVVILLSASGIYVIERDAQPAFDSIPKAIWWAAVTLTTVGYGDVVPQTVFGKVFGLGITVAGVGMVALPAGILASGFSQELQRRREQYRLEVQDALADGRVSKKERKRLEKERNVLGLTEAEATLVLRAETLDASNAATSVCPHCGEPLE